MFALAIFHVSRRGGLHDRAEAARLFASAAKLGHAAGRLRPRLALTWKANSSRRISVALRNCSGLQLNRATRKAQYALAKLYKDGKGVEKNPVEARAPACRRRGCGKTPTPKWEYAIALFNGNRASPRMRPRAGGGCSARPLCAVARLPRTAWPSSSAVGPRRGDQSDRSDQMAPDRQSGGQWRSCSRPIRRQSSRRKSAAGCRKRRRGPWLAVLQSRNPDFPAKRHGTAGRPARLYRPAASAKRAGGYASAIPGLAP